MPAETYGSAIVTPVAGVGGRYFSGHVLDKDIASFRNLQLWFDGKAITGLAPLRGRDRIGGRAVAAATVAASPAIVPSAVDFDGPGFSMLKTAAQVLQVADYTLPTAGYHFLSVVDPTNTNTSVRGLFGHLDGTGDRARWWLSQAAPGDPLAFFMNHAASGGGTSFNVAAGSTGIVAGVRHLLWGSYDGVNQVVALGRGLTVLGSGVVTRAPKVSAGMAIFGTGTNTQEFFGRGDAFLLGAGPLWNAYADNPVNAMRAALVTLLGTRYGVAV